MEAFWLAENVMICMSFIVSFLVWPPALVSLLVLGYRSYKQELLLETLPLLVSQFNTFVMWGAQACYSVGVFN
jgi:hypothetical protein